MRLNEATLEYIAHRCAARHAADRYMPNAANHSWQAARKLYGAVSCELWPELDRANDMLLSNMDVKEPDIIVTMLQQEG